MRAVSSLVLAGWLALAAGAATAQVLITPSWRITLGGCEEGEVACDDVKFDGVDRKSGKKLRLTGRTLHTTGRDGVTPSRFLGYEFRRDGLVYRITDDGMFTVTRGKREVLRERGAWED